MPKLSADIDDKVGILLTTQFFILIRHLQYPFNKIKTNKSTSMSLANLFCA